MRQSFLPPMVAPIADAPVRLNSSRQDMRDLAADLGTMPVGALMPFMAAVFGNGLMFTHGIIRLSIWISMKRRKITRSQAWALAYISVDRRAGTQTLANLLVEKQQGLVQHILYGKDGEDRNSVGGLSKREAQALSNLLTVARRDPACGDTRVYDRAACNRVHGALVE